MASDAEAMCSRINRRAESEIQDLANKLNLLTDKIGDVDDLMREHLRIARNLKDPA